MDIRHKLYPYPVLITTTDDFEHSSFSFSVSAEQGVREIHIVCTMDLQNEEMCEMIRRGDAEYLVHIECPQTCFRQVVVSDEPTIGRRIPDHQLNGKVAVCGFVVAKRDLPDYRNSDFNSDYEGLSFSVDRGSILAVAGQSNILITKDKDELTKIPSIFSICKYAAEDGKSMTIDIDGDKIVVGLQEETFQNYKMLTSRTSLLPVFHAMIIVPALVYTFETLRREGTENFDTRRWFIAIRKALAKYGVVLDEKTLNDVASYDLAQKLLDMPVDRALSAITGLDDGEEE